MWEREAEDNTIERLQRAGVMAPEGEVDQVMQTVVNNLIFTNNLNIQPEVRTRVLLTTPLESFTIGHTIVLSRGLVDVLPDEASLAMVLAHELAHIALGHALDTKFAFNDRMFFADRKTFRTARFFARSGRGRGGRPEGDGIARQFSLQGKAGRCGPVSASLTGASLRTQESDPAPSRQPSGQREGDSHVNRAQCRSPARDQQHRPNRGLALGARIRLDPWSCRVEFVKARPVALTTSREKMPFEITPFFPYLTRLSSSSADRVAQTAPVQ